MQQFREHLGQLDKQYYNRINFTIGLPQPFPEYRREKLSNSDVHDYCRFNPCPSQEMASTIQKYKDPVSGDTCLHVAAEYGNLPMIRHIIQQKLLKVDALNQRKDTPLLHTLRRSTSDDFEKAVTLLSKYSDLGIKDLDGKYPFELPLPIYTKARVRILEMLREQFYGTLGQA